jgi:hypothetical protein
VVKRSATREKAGQGVSTAPMVPSAPADAARARIRRVATR